MGAKFSSIVSVITGNRNEIVVSAGQQTTQLSEPRRTTTTATSRANSPSMPTRNIQPPIVEPESGNQQQQEQATIESSIAENQAIVASVDTVAVAQPPSVVDTYVAPRSIVEEPNANEPLRVQPLEQASQAVAYGKPFMIRVDLPRSPAKSTPSRVRRLSKMLFSNLGSPKGTNATLESNNNSNNQIAAFSGEDDPNKRMSTDPMRSTKAFFRRFSSPNMLWGRPGSTSTVSSPANSPNVTHRGLTESGGTNPQQLVDSATQGLDPHLLPTPLHSSARRGSTASTSLKYQGTSGGSSTLSSTVTNNVNIQSLAVIADPSLASLEENGDDEAIASQPGEESENFEHISLIRALGGHDEVTASSSPTSTPFSSHHSNANVATTESRVQGQELTQVNQESTTTSGGLQREASSTRTSSTNEGAAAQANPVRSSSHSSGSNSLLRMLPRKLSKFGKSSLMSGGSGVPHSAFWCADEMTRECHLGDFCQTSLLTFHAQNADAVNVKGMDGPVVQVPTQAIVTIYANVGTGRYLSISHDLTGVVLRFDTAPREIREDASVAIRCEFIVRRAYPGSNRESGDGSDSIGPLYFGDSVTLESRYMPGAYLCIQSNKLSLTTTCAAASMTDDNSSLLSSKLFILHSPTLRELVQINAQAAASPPPSSTFISPSGQILDGVIQGNDFEREEARQEAEKQRQWMEAMAAQLPVDLAQRVFEYHRDWIRTARLTCKTWKAQAEKRIRRIRVNGEFCSLETDEEKFNLTDFVRRCANLEVLTLRNVISLTDEDIARIVENTNLSSLVLGGCRRLSDRSTRLIAAKLTRLIHLNMALTDITDESIRIVAEEAERLRELNLYNCPRVTADGINSVDPKGFIHLEHINLRGTVTDSHLVQDFRRKKPSVVVLTGPASADSIWG